MYNIENREAYYALLLAIVKNLSVDEALLLMGKRAKSENRIYKL